MRRLETRYLLGCLTLIAFLVQLVFLAKLFIDNNSLVSENDALNEDIRLLKQQYHDTSNCDLRPAKPKRLRNHEIASVQPQESSKLLNLFIETTTGSTNHSTGRQQFFKVPGSTSNEALYSQVTQLPEDRRKRILVTGGAGFVGECSCVNCCLINHITLSNWVNLKSLQVATW